MQRTWVDETREAAQGHWREILGAFGIDVPATAAKHCACPGCGGTDRFRFDDKNGRGTFICSAGGGDPVAGDGFKLLEHVNGWRFMDAARKVADVLGIDTQSTQRIEPTLSAQIERRYSQVTRMLQEEQQTQDSRARAQKGIDTVLAGCVPLRSVPAVWRYLTETRGIGEKYLDATQNLLAHPGIPYFYKARKDERSKNMGTFPALIGICRSAAGEVVTLHRTYLTEQGEKLTMRRPDNSLMDARKLMPPASDSRYSIPLYTPLNGRLGVAEGIESALAAAILNDLPCESAIDSGKLIHYAPPPHVQALFVFADDDPAGRHGAESLKARLQIDRPEIAVHIHYPRSHPDAQPGQDWNDVLRMGTGPGHKPAVPVNRRKP